MIEDIRFIRLEIHTAKRGSLIEIIKQSQLYLADIAQINLINDPIKGIIRAWHKHHKMWEAFFCSHGVVKFALYDDREGSSTYRMIDTFVFSEREPSVLIVPPGVYHGHISLQDDVQIITVCSQAYNKEAPDEERVPYNSFGYTWNVTV